MNTPNTKALSDLLLLVLGKLPLPLETFLFAFITTLAPAIYNLFTDPNAPAITSNVIVAILSGAVVSGATSLAHSKTSSIHIAQALIAPIDPPIATTVVPAKADSVVTPAVDVEAAIKEKQV